MPTLIKFLEVAQANDGLYPFEANLNSEKSIKDQLRHFFTFKIKVSRYLNAPFDFSKSRSDKLTPMLKRYVDDLVVFNQQGDRFINVYAVFNIPNDKRTPEALTPFIIFYQKMREYVLEHYTKVHIKFLYETQPMRMELHVGLEDEPDDDLVDADEYTKELQAIIDEHEEIQNWLSYIATHIKKIGRWSLFGIWNESLITTSEQLDLMNKHYGNKDEK